MIIAMLWLTATGCAGKRRRESAGKRGLEDCHKE